METLAVNNGRQIFARLSSAQPVQIRVVRVSAESKRHGSEVSCDSVSLLFQVTSMHRYLLCGATPLHVEAVSGKRNKICPRVQFCCSLKDHQRIPASPLSC